MHGSFQPTVRLLEMEPLKPKEKGHEEQDESWDNLLSETDKSNI